MNICLPYHGLFSGTLTLDQTQFVGACVSKCEKRIAKEDTTNPQKQCYDCDDMLRWMMKRQAINVPFGSVVECTTKWMSNTRRFWTKMEGGYIQVDTNSDVNTCFNIVFIEN